MTPRIVKTPRAEQDLIEHFAFIAKDKVALAASGRHSRLPHAGRLSELSHLLSSD
jgi:plasmid stabilization system protein ParE